MEDSRNVQGSNADTAEAGLNPQAEAQAQQGTPGASLATRLPDDARGVGYNVTTWPDE